MSIYIIAQLIGFVGYLFYVSAPHQKTRLHIIRMEAIACSFLCVQWFLLGQSSLIALNMFVIVISITATLAEHKTKIRAFMPALYPIGIAVLLFNANGTIIDALAIIALCCQIKSKSSSNSAHFRGFASMASSTLVISSTLAQSIPAIMFNILYTIGHLQHVPNAPYTQIRKKLVTSLQTNFSTQ